MPRSTLTRLRTPMDNVPADTFRELAEFVRRNGIELVHYGAFAAPGG